MIYPICRKIEDPTQKTSLPKKNAPQKSTEISQAEECRRNNYLTLPSP